ncbi:peptidoglycan-binding domain-containing protein, partial [Lachnoanaerobaculum orale]
MDKMVQKVQTWLMEHYNGKDRFETIKEEDIDGIAGTGTVRRLIEALQIELNENFNTKIIVDGSFGLGTLKGLPAIIGKGYNIPNIVCIIQGSLWCKGYSAGEIDGIYGDGVVAGVRRFQRDAG